MSTGKSRSSKRSEVEEPQKTDESDVDEEQQLIQDYALVESLKDLGQREQQMSQLADARESTWFKRVKTFKTTSTVEDANIAPTSGCIKLNLAISVTSTFRISKTLTIENL